MTSALAKGFGASRTEWTMIRSISPFRS